MRNSLVRLFATAILLCLSGTAAALNVSVGSCTDNVQTSSSGLTGSVSCTATCTSDSSTTTVTASFSGSYTGSFSGGFGTGACAGGGSVSFTKTGIYQGYLWTCSASGTGLAFSGSCTVTAGGVAGATSASGAQQQLQATVAQQVTSISAAVSTRMLSGVVGPQSSKQAASTSGMAAGGAANQWNAWSSLSKNDSSYSPAEGGKRREMSINNVVVGADYQLQPSMLLGVSVAIDRGDGSVTAAATGTSTSGYSLAPYLGLQLGANTALDLAVGLGKGIAKQAGGIEAKSDRQFFASNLGYAQWIGDIQLVGKAGYLVSQELYGDSTTNGQTISGTAAKNRIQQLNLGMEAGYWLNGVMPYVGLGYTRDVRMKTAVIDNSWDRDALILKAGVNFFSIANKMTGGIAYMGESSRRNARNGTLIGNISIKF